VGGPGSSPTWLSRRAALLVEAVARSTLECAAREVDVTRDCRGTALKEARPGRRAQIVQCVLSVLTIGAAPADSEADPVFAELASSSPTLEPTDLSYGPMAHLSRRLAR